MIDESKQDLLVQYLLGELDSTTAAKLAPKSRSTLSFGILLTKWRKHSHRWPTPQRRWLHPLSSLNEFSAWSAEQGKTPGQPLA